MARKIRIAVSLILMTALSIALTATGAAATGAFGFTLSFQFMALLLGGAIVMVACWLTFTLIFGRLYCSGFCPLGTLQDIFFSARHIPALKKKLRPMRYCPPAPAARTVIAAAYLLIILAGYDTVAMIIEPVAVYRKLLGVFTPGNATALLSGVFSAIALILFAMVSLRRGRIWCNTICPVGTALGSLSKRSFFRFEINPDLCTSCGKCEEVCKAQAINLSDLRVDNSRCVACFNCTAVCPEKAIRYTSTRHRPATPLFTRTQ